MREKIKIKGKRENLKEEEERKFSPKEEYILKFTLLGKILKEKEKFKISSLEELKERVRGPGKRLKPLNEAIEVLIKTNVLEIENGQIKKINWENLERAFEETNGGKIFELVKENKVLNQPLLQRLLKKELQKEGKKIPSYYVLSGEISALLAYGLLTRVRVGGEFLLVSPELRRELEEISEEESPRERKRKRKKWEEKIWEKFEEVRKKFEENSENKVN